MENENTVIYGNLNLIREKMIQHIMSHDDLMKFIYYKDVDKDIAELPNLSKKQKATLIDTKIFKRRRMPSTSDKADVMISMEYGIRHYANSNRNSYMSYVAPRFCINVISHESIDETDNGSRILAIEDCLLQLFHNKQVGALGKTFVAQTDPLLCPQGYIGITVSVKFFDLLDIARD